MTSTVRAALPTQAERVAERIRAHKEEVARLRERIGDPQEALSRFVTEHFEVRALIPDEQPGEGGGNGLWDDDDLDAG